jgi:hypothetical protein
VLEAIYRLGSGLQNKRVVEEVQNNLLGTVCDPLTYPASRRTKKAEILDSGLLFEMVAGDCNAPNTPILVVPFRLSLSVR